MTKRIPLIAGNWKMNLTLLEAEGLIKAIKNAMKGLRKIEVLIAPPFTGLAVIKKMLRGSRILLAGQNMHWESSGAFTGEISAAMLSESGCTHVILGHSERRTLFQETDTMINRKTTAAVTAGLLPIVCIGETLIQREAGETFKVIKTQLEGSLNDFLTQKKMPDTLILAYEPVWAIGTGKTATPAQAQEIHFFIREWLKEQFGPQSVAKMRILYGGSVNPDNIKELMAQTDIDGVLVGGASLKADSFVPIIKYR